MFEDRVDVLNEETEAMLIIPYEKRMYSVDEIQSILGISKTTVYNLVKSNVFHSVKVGEYYRIYK